MKVYIVMHEFGDDYEENTCVAGVYSTYEEAKNNMPEENFFSRYWVEEWEVK